jgi:hypothetical protein
VIVGFLVLAKLEKKDPYAGLMECQISKQYVCYNWGNCKGNPIGCKYSVKKVNSWKDA